jgi:hypothetical protein
MFTAGRAAGRIKTGLHIDGAGSTVSRVGYTLQKVMGLDTPVWGEKSNQTTKDVGEILT